jgi:hypothetical protein
MKSTKFKRLSKGKRKHKQLSEERARRILNEFKIVPHISKSRINSKRKSR